MRNALVRNWITSFILLSLKMIPQFHFLLKIRMMNRILCHRFFHVLNTTRRQADQRSPGRLLLTGEGSFRPVWTYNSQISCLSQRRLSPPDDGVNQESQIIAPGLGGTELETSVGLNDKKVGEFAYLRLVSQLTSPSSPLIRWLVVHSLAKSSRTEGCLPNGTFCAYGSRPHIKFYDLARSSSLY